jgi:hypothetical protein
MGTTEQKAEFAVELKGDELVASAESAAGALAKLHGQLRADTAALGEMQRAMRALQGGGGLHVEQYLKLKMQIDAQKKSIAQAQSSYLALGGTFTKTGTHGRGLEARIAALTKQAQGMPGPLGGVLARLGSMAKLVAGGGPIAIGLVAIAAALAALTVATVAAIRSLYNYGVAQGDARRSELLRLEGLTKLRFLYQRMPGNAKEMQGAIDQVAASSALGRDKIAAYSEQLYRMGLRGGTLTAALEGVAIKASTQGDAAANVFAGWAAGAALTGRSVRKLADDVKARLGGIADKQLASSAVQAEKLTEAYNALFTDLSMDRYLSAWKSVNDLLSQSTASGRALKQIVGLILQPLIDQSTAAAPIVKRFFQGMILGAQSITIAILTVRLWFRRTFGKDTLSGIDLTKAAVIAGKIAVWALAGGLGVAAVAVGALAVKLTALLVPALWSLVTVLAPLLVSGIALAMPFLLAAAAIYSVINTARLLYQLWDEIDWKDLGTSIWRGIVDGLKAGFTWVDTTMTDLTNKVLDAFMGPLGIKSPSKVFMRLGLEIPRGMSIGVKQGAPEAQAAVDTMVPRTEAPAPAPAAGPAAPAPRPRRGGNPSSITVGDIHIHTSSDKPREIALDLKREIEAVFERVAMQLGAPIAGDS